MNNMINEYVIDAIKEYKIIAIMRKIPADRILATAEALYKGGIRLIEVTFDQGKKTGEQETLDAIKELEAAFKGRMHIGAGTVVTESQVEKAVEAGAKYIISPNTDEAVIRKTKALGAVSIPGAFTPTEIVRAHQAGADFVKVFPAGDLGVGYLKAVRAPLSHIPMLAVGGVDENNLQDYLESGMSGVGVGSNIVKMSLIQSGDYEKIEELARKYTCRI